MSDSSVDLAEQSFSSIEHDLPEDVRVLVREIRSNKTLIKKTTRQVQDARKSVSSRTAWKDFVKKYF